MDKVFDDYLCNKIYRYVHGMKMKIVLKEIPFEFLTRQLYKKLHHKLFVKVLRDVHMIGKMRDCTCCLK